MTRLRALVFQIMVAGAIAAFPAAALANQPVDRGIGFQPPASVIMERLEGLHNHILLTTCIVIVLLVAGLLGWCVIRYNRKANPKPASFHHNTLLEVVWTGIPVLILIGIAIPSFRLLAFEEINPETAFTIKATGSQWYWDYEYPDHGDFSFTSKMLTKDEATAANKPYLLGVDKPIYVPVNTNVRIIVTASDVLHSWAIPAFGVKMDGVPGRINDTWFRVEREGIYYGQCSELCGARHAFMPIEVHVVSQSAFDAWIATMKSADAGAAPASVAANR